MRAVLFAAGLLLATQGPAALGCGHCAEDKVAATYDHAVVTRAAKRGHAMVYSEVVGIERAEHGWAPALVAVLEAVPGVDRGTVRLSAAPAAVSFSMDSDGYAVDDVIRTINRKLANRKLALTVLQVVDARKTAARK